MTGYGTSLSAIPLLEHGSVRLGNMRRGVLILPPAPDQVGALSTRAFAVLPYGTLDEDLDERRHAVHAAAASLEQSLERAVPDFDRSPPLYALSLLRSRLAGVPAARIAAQARRIATTSGAAPGWDDLPFHAWFGPARARSREEHLARKLRVLAGELHPSLAAGRHVLVSGPGRSGTRWLLETVSRLSALAAPTLALARMLPGEPGSDPRGRREWDERVAACNLYFAPADAPAVRDAVARLPVAQTVQLVCPPDVVVTAKCSPRFALPAWRGAFPRTKVVFVERDPRNVVLSRRRYFPERRLWTLRWPAELAATAALIAGNRLRAVLHGDLVVRYEDMIGDLPGQLRRIGGFLGIRPTDDALDAVARDLTFEAMAGRPVGAFRDGDHFRGGSDWTRELTRGERAVLVAFDPLLRALGYPSAAASLGAARPGASG